jgi:transposase
MDELRDLVIAGPDAAIHKVVRWGCLDLRDENARRFGVTFKAGTIGKLLRKLRLTRLQPRPVHPKKEPAAEQAFKKTLFFAERRLAWHVRRHAGGDLVSG